MEMDERLPMMPIREVVIFPHMTTPFVVGRQSSVRALTGALAGDKENSQGDAARRLGRLIPLPAMFSASARLATSCKA